MEGEAEVKDEAQSPGRNVGREWLVGLFLLKKETLPCFTREESTLLYPVGYTLSYSERK